MHYSLSLRLIDILCNLVALVALLLAPAQLGGGIAIACGVIGAVFLIGLRNQAFRYRVFAPQEPRLVNDGLAAMLTVALFGTGHPLAGALYGAAVLIMVLYQRPPQHYTSV